MARIQSCGVLNPLKNIYSYVVRNLPQGARVVSTPRRGKTYSANSVNTQNHSSATLVHGNLEVSPEQRTRTAEEKKKRTHAKSTARTIIVLFAAPRR